MAKSNGNRGSAPVIEPFEGNEEFGSETPASAAAGIQSQEAGEETQPLDHEPKVADLAIELPIGVVPVGYNSREITTVTLTHRQAMAFAMLQDGLDRTDARTQDGQHVGSQRARVLRWLMEKVADAYGL